MQVSVKTLSRLTRSYIVEIQDNSIYAKVILHTQRVIQMVTLISCRKNLVKREPILIIPSLFHSEMNYTEESRIKLSI